MPLPVRRLGATAAALAAGVTLAFGVPAPTLAVPLTAPGLHPGAPTTAGRESATDPLYVPAVPTRGLNRRSPSVTPASSGNALIKLSPRSFFYDDISRAPLDANSAAIAAHISGQVRNNWGGVAAFNAHQWNTTFYRVDAGTPRIRVKWSNCLKFSWTPAGIYTGKKVFVDVPVPANAVPAPGSDGAMSLYDPAADTAWEFWQMKKDATGTWQACQGGRIDKVSQAMGQFPVGFGVSASGLSMTAGTISAAEVRAGRIDHALYLGVINARWFSEFSWPAVRSDGYTKNAAAPLEGQRLRLDPRLNVDALPIGRFAKVVARAAQKYGFIVMDKGGAVALVGEGAQSLKATTGSDPWPSLLDGPDYQALKGFPWDRLQVLPKDYGRR